MFPGDRYCEPVPYTPPQKPLFKHNRSRDTTPVRACDTQLAYLVWLAMVRS